MSGLPLNLTARPSKSILIKTKYERELEKAQTMLDRHSELKNKNTRNKKVIRRADTAEERAKREVEKAEAFRKREEKRQKRGNRIRAGLLGFLPSGGP